MLKAHVFEFEKLQGDKNVQVRRFANFVLLQGGGGKRNRPDGTQVMPEHARVRIEDEVDDPDDVPEGGGGSKEQDDMDMPESGGGGGDDTHAKLMQVLHHKMNAPYLAPARKIITQSLGQDQSHPAPSTNRVLQFELAGSGINPFRWSFDPATATWDDAYAKANEVYGTADTYKITLHKNHDELIPPSSDLIGAFDGDVGVMKHVCMVDPADAPALVLQQAQAKFPQLGASNIKLKNFAQNKRCLFAGMFVMNGNEYRLLVENLNSKQMVWTNVGALFESQDRLIMDVSPNSDFLLISSIGVLLHDVELYLFKVSPDLQLSLYYDNDMSYPMYFNSTGTQLVNDPGTEVECIDIGTKQLYKYQLPASFYSEDFVFTGKYYVMLMSQKSGIFGKQNTTLVVLDMQLNQIWKEPYKGAEYLHATKDPNKVIIELDEPKHGMFGEVLNIPGQSLSYITKAEAEKLILTS